MTKAIPKNCRLHKAPPVFINPIVQALVGTCLVLTGELPLMQSPTENQKSSESPSLLLPPQSLQMAEDDRLQIELALAAMAAKGYTTTMVASMVAASAIVLALWSPANEVALAIWYGLLLNSMAVRLPLARRVPLLPEMLAAWNAKWTAGSAISGLIWGSLSYVVLSPQEIDTQVLIYLTFMAAGVTGAATFLHAASFNAAASFQCGFLIPFIIHLASYREKLQDLEAVTTASYLAALLISSWRMHEQIRRTQIAEQMTRRTSALLATQELGFRSLAENVPDNIVRWDTKGRYLYINPTHEHTLMKSASQVVGRKIPDSHMHVKKAIAQVVSSGQGVYGVRQPVPTADGKSAIHEVSLIPERNSEGKIVSVLAVGRDVTAQLAAQEALATSERQFRTLAENLPSFLARYTPGGRVIYLSPRLERLLQRCLDDVAGRTLDEIWTDGRYSDYGGRIAQVGCTGIDQELELPGLDERGGPAVYQIHLLAERNKAGEIVSVLSIGHDITERKRIEAETRMAANVFDASNEGIFIADPTGTIIKANPACTRITGYAHEEIVGRPAFMIAPHLHGESSASPIWQSLQAQGIWAGEIESRRRNESPFTMRLSISAVRDDKHEVIQYVGIFSDISQLKRHEIELEYIAHHDTLTSLPNRVLLIDRLQQAMARVDRMDQLLAVLFIDLDGFKPVNDRLGHHAGDHVLVEMGKRLQGSLRASDTVARIGGDEFVVLLPGLSNTDECELLTRRLLKDIAEPIQVEGHSFSLSASAGIALYPSDADDADTLLRHADEAMYSAKRTGRNQYVFCNTASPHRGQGSSTVHDLRIALEQGQIEVHFQPIVHLKTGRITKAEALVRWRHPERGLVPPAEFIPIAEDTGLINAIGTRVFGKALKAAIAWNRLCSVGSPHRISVNRSPREFQDPDGVQSWMALLAEQGPDAGRMLVVEITEGLLLDDRPKVMDQLAMLRSAGLEIALDDFGTGFSSLAYLKKFAIDYLKIDRSFVLDIEHDPSDRVIVESVIAMARHLGIKLIAEGVENEDQASLLAAAHCDYAQGYLYARPMPEAEFLEFVARVQTTPIRVPDILSAALDPGHA